MSVELQYEEKTQRTSRFTLKGILQDPALLFAIAVISVFLFLFIIYPMLKIVIYPSSETWRRFLQKHVI